MQRGPKLTAPARKKLAGTYKPSVDGDTKPLVEVVKDAPVAPSWLSDDAKEVWADELPRLVACGATAKDSAMVALYCTTLADFIASVKAREPANAAFRSELRKQMEMLGVAGTKSRLAKIAAGEQKSNPFSVLKK